MKKHLLALACFSWLIPVSGAWAEPYFAAWKGVNCNACHVNETGGWLRNDFGKNYGNSLQTFDWEGISDAVQKIQHNTPSWVATGVDLHESYDMLFNSNFAIKQTGFNFDPTNTSDPYTYPQRTSFSLQAKANETVSGAFTYKFTGSSGVKELYALVSGLPQGGYIKLGEFMLPYGLTLSDDNSLVRVALAGDFSFDNTTNDGIEAGIYPDPFFLNAALVNSGTSVPVTDSTGAVTATYSGMTFSAKGGMCFSRFTLGGSIYGTNLDLGNQRMRYGAYGWGRIEPVVILAEYDGGYDGQGANYPGPMTSQNNYRAYHVSAEVDLGNSVYLRLANEWLSDSLNANTNDGFRDVLSLRCYPVRNLRTQIDFIRVDPNAVANQPTYALVADAFMFY